jgi:hypothetical protein
MLERSTLTVWLGQAARLLTPLALAIGRHVLRAEKIHSDDTPIQVLAGKGSKPSRGGSGPMCAMAIDDAIARVVTLLD